METIFSGKNEQKTNTKKTHPTICHILTNKPWSESTGKVSLLTPTARNTVGRRSCGWGLRGSLRLPPGVVGRDSELFSHDSTFPSFSLLLFLLHLLVAAWALRPRQPGLNTLRTELGLESGRDHSWQLECVFIPIYFLGLLCSPNPPNSTKRHE